MSATLTPTPVMQFLDSNGNPLSGGLLYTYAAGTTTPLATYTDYGGATPNANPVVLNSRGEASIWLSNALYKFMLKDSTGALIWTADNIGGEATLAALAASSGSSLIGFINAGTGAVARTLQDKGRDIINAADYSTLQQAITAAAGKTLEGAGASYTITTALSLPSSIVIQNVNIIGNEFSGNLLTATSVNNVTFRNCKITSAGSYSTVMTFTLCNALFFENCIFNSKYGSSLGSIALRFYGSTNVTIQNCQFFDADSFVYLDKSGTTYSDYISVLNSRFEHTFLGATNNPTGVYQFNCNNLLVDGCTFVNIRAGGSSPISGYSVYEGDGTTGSLTVTNCITTVSTAYPHVMVQSSNALYCSITNNKFYGTALGAGGTKNYIANVRSALSAVLIQGNYSQQGCISVAGGATAATATRVCEILDNQIIKLEQNTAGIQIGYTGAYYVDYFSVKNNTVSQSYASSIYIAEGNYGVVENNKCLNWNTQNYGPTNVYVYTAAVYWSGTSMRGVLRGNILENNAVGVVGYPQYGLVADAGSSVACVDNKIIGSMTLAAVLNLVQAGYPSDNAFRIALQAGSQILTEPLMFLAYWDDTGTGTLRLTVRNAANTVTRTASIAFS